MTDRLAEIRARLEAMKANGDEWVAFHANAGADIAYLLEEVERLRASNAPTPVTITVGKPDAARDLRGAQIRNRLMGRKP
jgi:hypothetical protein